MIEFVNKLKIISLSKIYENMLCLLILVAPIVVYGITIESMSLRLSRLVIILLAPMLFYKIYKRPSVILRDKFLLFGMIPYTLYATLSLIWISNNPLSFGLNRLFSFYEIFFVYVAFIVADLNLEKFKKVIKMFLIGSLVPIAISVREFINNFLAFSPSQLPFPQLLIPGKYEVFKGRWNLLTDEISRSSSTYAEPTIFGCAMSLVFLLSLGIEFKERWKKVAIFVFQLLVVFSILASMAKLALIMLLIGFLVIYRKHKKTIFFSITAIAVAVIFIGKVFSHYQMDRFIMRFTTDSGHIDLMLETLIQLESINFLVGAGVGSIPAFTTNKFILSRFYENGILGLIFSIQVTLLMAKFYFYQVKHSQLEKIWNVCLGSIAAILIGLHLYDYFIYLWVWILIGALMSFYNNVKYSQIKKAN